MVCILHDSVNDELSHEIFTEKRRIPVKIHADSTDIGRANITIQVEKVGNDEIAVVLEAVEAIKAKFGDAPGISGMGPFCTVPCFVTEITPRCGVHQHL